MILIDPKVVELSIFSALPHLFCPVVTEPKKAAGALRWAVTEMEQRYGKMGKVNARDIYRYNAMQEREEDKWPRLVIIIDELADLMMVASRMLKNPSAALRSSAEPAAFTLSLQLSDRPLMLSQAL